MFLPPVLDPIPNKDYLGAFVTQDLIRKESELDSDPIKFGKKYIPMFFLQSMDSGNIFAIHPLRGTWTCYAKDIFIKHIIDIWYNNYYIPYEEITPEEKKKYGTIIRSLKRVFRMNYTHHIIFKDGMIYDYNLQKFIERIKPVEFSVNVPIKYTFEECFEDIDVAFNLLRHCFQTDDDMEAFLDIVLDIYTNRTTYDHVSISPQKQAANFFVAVIVELFPEEYHEKWEETKGIHSIQLRVSPDEEDILCLRPYARAIIGVAISKKLKYMPKVSTLCFNSYQKLQVQFDTKKHMYGRRKLTEDFPCERRCISRRVIHKDFVKE